MDATEARRTNLVELIAKNGTIEALAEITGSSANHLSQIKNSERGMGPKVARRFEEKLGLSRGWMDAPHPVGGGQDVEGEELPFGGEAIPVVGYVLGGDKGFFEETGHATGHGEGYVTYPTKDKGTYALRVRGDSMRPRIKPGEYIVVMPGHHVMAGDEVVVRTQDGRVMVKKLGMRRSDIVELQSINEADHPPITLEAREIVLMHYVGGIAKDYLYRTSI